MQEGSRPTDLITPFRIGDGASLRGPRLGGKPPEGIGARLGFEYFVTFPVVAKSDLFCSVFVEQNYEAVAASRGQVVRDGPVDLVFHDDAPRSAVVSSWDSVLSEHPLEIGDQEPDWQEEEGVLVPNSVHKLNGRPYLVARGGGLEDQVANLLMQGYFQCLQIDFPGSTDGDVSGNWPFGAGMFHVLINDTLSWRCFWEF